MRNSRCSVRNHLPKCVSFIVNTKELAALRVNIQLRSPFIVQRRNECGFTKYHVKALHTLINGLISVFFFLFFSSFFAGSSSSMLMNFEEPKVKFKSETCDTDMGKCVWEWGAFWVPQRSCSLRHSVRKCSKHACGNKKSSTLAANGATSSSCTFHA